MCSPTCHGTSTAPEPRRRGSTEIQRDGNRARQADLAAMGVAAEDQIEIRHARPGDRSPACAKAEWKNASRGISRSRLFDIVDPVIMGVVDAGQINALPVARDRLAFVEQHADSHRFEARDHADRVMVAQHAVNRAAQTRRAIARMARKCRPRYGPIGRAAIISGQHTDVIDRDPGSSSASRRIAPSLMSAWGSLICSRMKPSKAGGSAAK